MMAKSKRNLGSSEDNTIADLLDGLRYPITQRQECTMLEFDLAMAQAYALYQAHRCQERHEGAAAIADKG